MRGRDMDALSLRASSPSVGYNEGHGWHNLANDWGQIPCRCASSPGREVRSYHVHRVGPGKRSKISSLWTWERKGSEGPLSVRPNECECVAWTGHN